MKFVYLLIFLILQSKYSKPISKDPINYTDKKDFFKINFDKFVQITLKQNTKSNSNNLFLQVQEKKTDSSEALNLNAKNLKSKFISLYIYINNHFTAIQYFKF